MNFLRVAFVSAVIVASLMGFASVSSFPSCFSFSSLLTGNEFNYFYFFKTIFKGC